MKKGEFYITTNTGIQKRDGYILQTARNVYGIHNGGSYCKNWIVTDLKTGLQVRDNFRTRKAAGDFIESTPTIEEKILAMRNDPNNDFINNCIKAINQAHTENPIDNTKPRRPVKYGYIIEEYPTNDGTNTTRARISPAAHPDCICMDIPESDLTQIMQQIRQETPKAYFIDKQTGQDIDLLSAKNPKIDTTPTAKTEPKRNRIPRKFTRLYITMLTDTTAGKAGTRAAVYRNQYGELVEETESGKLYAANLALLRTADLVRIDKIETEEPTPDTTPADVIPEESPAKEPAAAPEESPAEDSPTLYKYGMRSRGYSIAAQPAGVVAREDDPTGIYYDVIIYERELTPAEVEHYSLDPLQPAREPAQAASQDATSPAIISDKETTTTSPENGNQAAREETPERLKESRRDNPGTTTPPGIYESILPPGPETVTESTNSQPGTPAAAHDARPRRGPTRPARTASHTDTHERRKTRYKPKYKARRTHAAQPRTTYFFKNPRFVGLVSENVTETICDTKGGAVFEQILGQLYTEGPPPGYQKMMQYPGNEKIKIKTEDYKMKNITNGMTFFDEANGRYLTTDGIGRDPRVFCCIVEEFNEDGELEITGRQLFRVNELKKFKEM